MRKAVRDVVIGAGLVIATLAGGVAHAADPFTLSSPELTKLPPSGIGRRQPVKAGGLEFGFRPASLTVFGPDDRGM